MLSFDAVLEVLFDCENRRIGSLIYLVLNSCIVRLRRLHHFLVIMLVRFALKHSEHQNEINQMKLIGQIDDEIIGNDKL